MLRALIPAQSTSISPSSLRFDQYLPAVPTREQVGAIIDSIRNPKHKAEIALLYSSGIRVSELCRLHCGDIRRSKGCIYVSKSKNRSDRFAVLSDKAYRDLVAYIRSSYRGAAVSDWLFPGRKTGSRICEQTVYNYHFTLYGRFQKLLCIKIYARPL